MKTIEWEDLELLIDKIEDELKGNTQFKYIYGIPRGGLILAVMLSHRLDLEFIQKLPTNHTQDILDSILIVDDIIDKGDTVKEYMKKGFNNFVCLHYKPSSNIPVIFSPQIKTDEEWIVYPWEKQMDEERQTTLDEFE